MNYDHLLESHLKTAFWGAAKAVGAGALNFGRGALGMGARQGAGIGGKALATAGMASAYAPPVLGSSATNIKRGPSASIGPFQIGGPKTASSRSEKPATYKLASVNWQDVVNPLSYAAMLGGSLVDHHEHPYVHYGLELGGLAGLGATTSSDLVSARREGRPIDSKDLLDLGALAAFGGTTAKRLADSAAGH